MTAKVREARTARRVNRATRATVLDHCVAKFGRRRGAMVAAHVAQWAIATRELGHVPTTVEYADWWAVSERTAWYHRADARAAFGDSWQATVQRLADSSASESRRALLALPAA